MSNPLNLTNTGETIFRERTIPGNASSPLNEPSLEDTRVWAGELEAEISAIKGAQSAGAIVFDTLATLNDNLNYTEFQKAEVRSDPTAANNGIYQKVGASGTGSWSKVSDLLETQVATDVADVKTVVGTDDGQGALVPRIGTVESQLIRGQTARNLLESPEGFAIDFERNSAVALSANGSLDYGGDIVSGSFCDFSRASEKIVVNGAGGISRLSNDVLPLSPARDKAVRLEGASSNLFERSRIFNGSWTRNLVSQQTGNDGLFGAGEMAKLRATNATGFHFIRDDVTLTGSEIYTLSLVGSDGGINPSLMSVNATGLSANAQPDFDAGSFTINSATADVIESKFTDLGNGIFRAELVFQATAAGGTANVDIYPAIGSVPGNNVDGLELHHAQLEIGHGATSLIDSSAADTTQNRAADNLTLAVSRVPFDRTRATVRLRVDNVRKKAGVLWSAYSSANEKIELSISDDGHLSLACTTGGTKAWTISAPQDYSRQALSISLTWAEGPDGRAILAINGTPWEIKPSNVDVPTSITTIGFGRGQANDSNADASWRYAVVETYSASKQKVAKSSEIFVEATETSAIALGRKQRVLTINGTSRMQHGVLSSGSRVRTTGRGWIEWLEALEPGLVRHVELLHYDNTTFADHPQVNPSSPDYSQAVAQLPHDTGGPNVAFPGDDMELILSRVGKVMQMGGDIHVVEYGMNDRQTTDPLTVAQVTALLKQYLDTVTAGPFKAIFVEFCPPLGEGDASGQERSRMVDLRNSAEAMIEERQIRGEWEQVHFIDLRDTLSDKNRTDGAMESAFTPDDVHATVLGGYTTASKVYREPIRAIVPPLPVRRSHSADTFSFENPRGNWLPASIPFWNSNAENQGITGAGVTGKVARDLTIARQSGDMTGVADSGSTADVGRIQELVISRGAASSDTQIDIRHTDIAAHGGGYGGDLHGVTVPSLGVPVIGFCHILLDAAPNWLEVSLNLERFDASMVLQETRAAFVPPSGDFGDAALFPNEALTLHYKTPQMFIEPNQTHILRWTLRLICKGDGLVETSRIRLLQHMIRPVVDGRILTGKAS